MKENKFNKLTKALLEHLTVKEDCTAGGAVVTWFTSPPTP